MHHVPGSVAFDLGPLGIGPTPLAILVAGLIVAAVLLVVVIIASQAGGAVVDKQWPANQPLSPTEVLWAESGGYVHRTFPGLDPVIARDLTQYITTKKVAPGTVIVEAGDLATQFVMLKSGSAEVLRPEGDSPVKAGASFGGDNILRRMPHQHTVRTTAPSEVVTLDAEDYLAGVALGMSDGDDDYVVHVLDGYFNVPATAPPPGAAMPPAPGAASSPSAPSQMAPPVAPRVVSRWALTTHSVVAPELPGYVLPAGDTPTRVLQSGTDVQQIEALPGWAHIRTQDGWQGWVSSSGLGPV